MGPKLFLVTIILYMAQPLVLVFATHEWVLDFPRPTASSMKKAAERAAAFDVYKVMANDTVSIDAQNHSISEAYINWHGIHPHETSFIDGKANVTQIGIRSGMSNKQTKDMVQFPITHVIAYYDTSLLFETAFHILLAVFAFQRSRLFAISQLFFGLFALMHHISHHHLTVAFMFWPTHYFFLFAMLLQPLSSGKPIRLRDALTVVCIDTFSVFRPHMEILSYFPPASLPPFLLLWLQWDNRAFRSWFLFASPFLLRKFYQCDFLHEAPHNEFDELVVPFLCIMSVLLCPSYSRSSVLKSAA